MLLKSYLHNLATINAEKFSKEFSDYRIEVKEFPYKWYANMLEMVREKVVKMETFNPYSDGMDGLILSEEDIETYYFNLCDQTVMKLITIKD